MNSLIKQKKNTNPNRFYFSKKIEEESLFDNINTSEEKYKTFYDDAPKYPYINISEISETEKKSGISTKNYFNINLNSYLSYNYYNYYNFTEMFYNCSSLYSFSDDFRLNKNVLDMRYMFFNFSSLSSLPDISELNIKNVTDISFLFYNCSSLKSMPVI